MRGNGLIMRVLIVTKIFPNALEPLSSPFNRQQFAALSAHADLRVLATIPWFPGAAWLWRWSRAGRLCGVPPRERIGRLEIEHPRFLFVPRIGHAWSGPLYAASLARRVLAERHRVDVILGCWAYPDGYAAIQLGRLLDVPVVVKLHGSDMNVVAKLPGPRRRLEGTLPHATRVAAVSASLAQAARELGVEAERIDVVRNGVEASLFHPRDRRAARDALGLEQRARIAAYVGRLERQKGVLDLLSAFSDVAAARPRARLLLVGDGVDAEACRRRAADSAGRIQCLGAQPLARVAEIMAAADVVTLPSHNEGMPNVVLEALASGRRVVATRVGGIPEIVASSELGELVDRQRPRALGAALLRALDADYHPSEVARAAGVPSWEQSGERLARVLSAATEQLRRAA